MPTRHGLNNTARGFFTKYEIEKMGYGTQRKRIGADSQLPFGDCALSLKRAVDPVVSPSGTIYSREAIYKYLLAKRKEMKRARAAYKRDQAKSRAEEDEVTQKRIRMTQDDFIAREKGSKVLSAHGSSFAEDVDKTKAQAKQALLEKFSEKMDTASREEKQAEIKKSAFWLPAHAPGHQRSKACKPPKRPLSPLSGKPLKLTDLVSIDLQFSDAGKPLCAVSQKEINFSEAVAIATSGKVMLKTHFEAMAAKSRICPVTGKKFKESDVINLRKAASGKAASGVVTAKHWRPAIK